MMVSQDSDTSGNGRGNTYRLHDGHDEIFLRSWTASRGNEGLGESGAEGRVSLVVPAALLGILVGGRHGRVGE